VVQVFQVRHGRVIERIELGTHAPIAGSRDGEALEAALQQFYELRAAPPEIHVPAEPDEREALDTWLSERAGRRVRILVPQRGEKRGLIDLANRNAALGYQTRFNQTPAAESDALEALQAVLALPALPRRIECFDISTIQGSETVASMVVCEEGRMRRAEYRKYRIRGDSGFRVRASGAPGDSLRGPVESQGKNIGNAGIPRPQSRVQNDVAAMHEVVLRRCRTLLEHGGVFPDLILVDGGRGQLSAAYAALEALGLANLVAAGIAKKEELLYTRDRADPIALAPSDPALLLVQRIRDEAHRFAVTFHRRARTIRDLQSALDQVPGVGARRRRTLLTAFGSVTGVRRATREELAVVIGGRAADRILAFFASRP
jgi:excinuclease ABC subunit C